MPRRSERLSFKGSKSYAEDFDSHPDDVVDLAQPHPPGSRKRKLLEGDHENDVPMACGSRKCKKPRPQKGQLQKLLDLPLDLVLEIFSLLDPLDLLHLAWTSKGLRRMLMSRSSETVWKAARSNIIPALPCCPEDLSEPEYAYLMFVGACSICSKKVKSLHIAWSARMRICDACLPKEFQETTPLWEHSYWMDSALSSVQRFVPLLTVTVKSGRNSYQREFYHIATDLQLLQAYKEANDVVAWAQAVRCKGQRIKEHAGACEVWYQDMLSIRKQERAAVIANRKRRVVEHLKKLGWDDELSRMANSDPKPQDQAEVSKICRKEITDQALSSLDTFLNAFMQKVRDRRFCNERNSMYKKRLLILRTVFQDYVATLPRDAQYPSMADLFADPRVKTLIEDTPITVDFKAEHLNPLRPIFPDIVAQWKERVQAHLIGLIKVSMPDYVFDEETVLGLAITSFVCREGLVIFDCSYNEYLYYPSILMHGCASSGDFCGFENGSVAHNLHMVFNESSWNQGDVIQFEPERMRILAAVVRLCGLDPYTTTRLQMDELDPIIECVSCHSTRFGRATMKWWGVLLHYFKVHHSATNSVTDMRLVVIDGLCATRFRAGIVEAKEREWSSEIMEDLKYFICNRCPQQDSLTPLLKHINVEHGIANSTSNDVRHENPSYYYPRGAFRLWPPRLIDVDEPGAVVVK